MSLACALVPSVAELDKRHMPLIGCLGSSLPSASCRRLPTSPAESTAPEKLGPSTRSVADRSGDWQASGYERSATRGAGDSAEVTGAVEVAIVAVAAARHC